MHLHTNTQTHTHLLVLSNASFITVNPSGVSSQAFTSAESEARGRRTTGPRVIPSARIRLLAPPPSYAEYVTEAHINSENTSVYPKRCPCCPQSLPITWPTVYPKTGKYVNANLRLLLCSLYWCWPQDNLLLLPLEPEILFHPSTEVPPLQQGWAYIQ